MLYRKRYSDAVYLIVYLAERIPYRLPRYIDPVPQSDPSYSTPSLAGLYGSGAGPVGQINRPGGLEAHPIPPKWVTSCLLLPLWEAGCGTNAP